MQPYPFSPFCPDKTNDCILSPYEAISNENGDDGWVKAAAGCDLFDPSTSGFPAALSLVAQADVVVLTLGIETCGMTPSHNVNPSRPGRCYQGKCTNGYVFPDQYLELEGHDRTTIDLPPVQHRLAKEVLAQGKPVVITLFNGGAVAIDQEAAHAGPAPLSIVEAFYPGPYGGKALARGSSMISSLMLSLSIFRPPIFARHKVLAILSSCSSCELYFLSNFRGWWRND